MKKTLQRGFTLIELLVVIAIIGILASVVLASLNDARSKGTDAAIQQSVSNVRAQAEIYGNQSNGTVNYDNLCTNEKILQIIAGIVGKNVTPVCASDTDSWAFSAPLVGDSANGICIDGGGNSQIGPVDTNIAVAAGCPDLTP